MPSLSHQGTPSPGDSNEAVIITSLAETPKRQKGPSEYQLRREANIAENQTLLASLGLGGGNALLDKSSTKGKRKKGGKGKRYSFCFFHTASLLIVVQHFFRSPNDGATSTTSATDQARPVTGSPPASTTSNNTSPSTIQPLAAAVASPSDDNPPALTSASNG